MKSLILYFLLALLCNISLLHSKISSNEISIKDVKILYSNFPNDDKNLEIAIADFSAMWAIRVGTLLKFCHEENKLNKGVSSIILVKDESLKNLPSGTFEIYIDVDDIIISSYNSEGICHALYTIAHQVLGARWYWPSALGFEWIGEAPKEYTFDNLRVEPSFDMRTLYPMDNDFSLRNRLSKGYFLNHNAAKIFKPKYKSLYPNIFSSVSTSQSFVIGDTRLDLQPNFANPLAVDITAKEIVSFFKKNPYERSFSISPNDNTLFDESELTKSIVFPLEYFRDRPNYSNLTFSFANQVANKVFNEEGLWETPSGEKRYITMLAYYWTEQTPEFPIHPRIMPILTSDRAQWHDESYRMEDMDLIRRWSHAGSDRLGTWDYYYGAPYPYPRQFNEFLSSSILYLYENNVDVFFSQIPSFWGLDGPKAWLTAQLLWDADQDYNFLIEEFYNEFFGKASDDMFNFYNLSEIHRTRNEGKASWIKYYYNEAGIELFDTKTIKKMRDHLDLAKGKVLLNTRFGKRVEVVSQAFRLTELYSNFHATRKSLVNLVINKGNQDKSINRKALDLLLARESFMNYIDTLKHKNLHSEIKNFKLLGQTDPIYLSLIPIYKNEMYLNSSLNEKYKTEYSIGKKWVDRPKSFNSLISNYDFKSKESNWVEKNFLGPKLPKFENWIIDFRASKLFKIDALNKSDSYNIGLRITNSDAFNIYHYCDVNKMKGYILKSSIDYKISLDCRAQLRIDWIDNSGNVIEQLRLLQLPFNEDNTSLKLEIPLVPNQNASRAKISLFILRQGDEDYIEIKEINFLEEID